MVTNQLLLFSMPIPIVKAEFAVLNSFTRIFSISSVRPLLYKGVIYKVFKIYLQTWAWARQVRLAVLLLLFCSQEMGSLIRPKYEICCSCKKPIIAFPKGKDKSALKAPFSVAYSRSVPPHHAFRISNARFFCDKRLVSKQN